MRSLQIRHAADLKTALSSATYLLFKHSTRCPISAQAFSEYRAFVSAHPEVCHGWIDVLADQPLSEEVAARTQVPHASPQALWLVDGRVAWHASHFSITQRALEQAQGT